MNEWCSSSWSVMRGCLCHSPAPLKGKPWWRCSGSGWLTIAPWSWKEAVIRCLERLQSRSGTHQPAIPKSSLPPFMTHPSLPPVHMASQKNIIAASQKDIPFPRTAMVPQTAWTLDVVWHEDTLSGGAALCQTLFRVLCLLFSPWPSFCLPFIDLFQVFPILFHWSQVCLVCNLKSHLSVYLKCSRFPVLRQLLNVFKVLVFTLYELNSMFEGFSCVSLLLDPRVACHLRSMSVFFCFFFK